MPRTDVLNRILACAAHELGPIVEKARQSRATVTLGRVETSLLVALKNLAASPRGHLVSIQTIHENSTRTVS